MDRVAISVAEAAKALGLGLTQTWKLVNAGEIRSFRVGDRVLIPVDEPAAFVARKMKEQP